MICLYSKYSQRCKEFMDDLDDDVPMRMLCIDNKEVRDLVLKDENGYHIKTVPCVFLFFPNGRLEKYEGSDAFVWLRKIREKNIPPPPPEKTIEEPPAVQEIVIPEKKEEVKREETVEEIMDKEMQMRQASDQIITRKNDNIKEIAQMMQRQRETEEERMNPPPPGSR